MLKIFSTKQLELQHHEDAGKKGFQLTDASFIEIKPIFSEGKRERIRSALQLPNPVLIFTSQNAVKTVLEYYLEGIGEAELSEWKLYCIAGATKTALLTRFREDQILGSADHAIDLVKTFSFNGNETIHFFCGNIRRNTIPDFLRDRLIPFKEWVVYNTQPRPQKIKDIFDGYLFYSPSGVSSFFSVNRIDVKKPCFSIGRTTAAAIKSFVSNPIRISGRTDTPHLLNLVEDYFKN